MIRILKHFVETTLKYTTVLKNCFEQRRNDFQRNDGQYWWAFPSVIAKSNTFSFNSNVRGYYMCMNIWNPVDGEILVCK